MRYLKYIDKQRISLKGVEEGRHDYHKFGTYRSYGHSESIDEKKPIGKPIEAANYLVLWTPY